MLVNQVLTGSATMQEPLSSGKSVTKALSLHIACSQTTIRKAGLTFCPCTSRSMWKPSCTKNMLG